jgi:hypothetical protein
MLNLIKPDWPAPENVHAYTTTRQGGYSEAPYDSFNIGDHSGDDPENVETNRQLLAEALDLPTPPVWLNQVHGNKIICIDTPPLSLIADGSFARTPKKVCVVMTADCLPLLITNHTGTIVAALHAGWRGLARGIIEEGFKILQRFDQDLLVWLGPAICQQAFEVGPEVREEFINADSEAANAFIPSPSGRWLADIYELARIRLRKLGITAIYGGDFCTYTDSKRFFSYRRDGKTGRMANLIWLSPSP